MSGLTWPSFGRILSENPNGPESGVYLQNVGFMGIRATGKRIAITGINIYRFAGGKIAEAWSNSDCLGMMQQLGAIPSMEQGAE